MPRPTPRKPDRPIFWIVAGPNGSGKSSFYNRTDIEGWGGSVWIINPDLLTAKIVESEQLPLEAANLAAVQRVEAWLDASLQTYQTIGVETVLSSGKYRRLVDKAHDRGFDVRMIYAVLDSLDDQYNRIRIRVSEGGHAVPYDKVKDRRARSFEQFCWFVQHVDRCFIFNNSGAEPEIAGIAVKGQLHTFDNIPADLAATLLANGVETG